MHDVPEFIRKAREIYGYESFLNDASGSLCELEDPSVFQVLAKHTIILYIAATDRGRRALLDRVEANPKPLYFREEFLEEHLRRYMGERKLSYVSLIDPDDFTRWVFPRLLEARLPRYEKIAAEHGYTVTTEEIDKVTDERSFLELLERALERGATTAGGHSQCH
jgi:hypothetical protein